MAISTDDKSRLFKFMLERVEEARKEYLEASPQAFGRWFINMYFRRPMELFVSDGAKDGKIDIFFKTHNGKVVQYHVVNAKFTSEFNKLAPPSFYEEIKYFWQAFENKKARPGYLQKAVKQELRSHYNQLFDRYDNGAAELLFVTNHRRNDGHYEQVKDIPALKVFHLDDLIQFLIDDIDGAMPRTPSIRLAGIHAVLSPDKTDTEVATSIVFARLTDFLDYMNNDPFDLLFNRNVRVPISLARSSVNRDIRSTFEKHPKEFAFSNNGITMLCEKQHYDPGEKVLTLDNPRVVNGSQTLHSIRDVSDPPQNARVMVRVIGVEPPIGAQLDEKVARRKDVINKIARRSNQQNPIKTSDLVSNDDFQMDLYRFFRSKGYFYERREREWNQRSRELRSIGVHQGPSLRWLAQLIASYNWSNKKLGPTVARGGLRTLFEGDLYDIISKTKPETAFQLFLLDSNLWESGKELAKKTAYIKNIRSYAHLVLCSIAVRILAEAGAKWGTPTLSTALESQWNDWERYGPLWLKLTKLGIETVAQSYKNEAKHPIHKEAGGLNYPNFFKNQQYIARILNAKHSAEFKQTARSLLS